MIQETIVTTQNRSGLAHIAPMGIHVITRDGVYAAGTSGTGAAITRDGVYAAGTSGTGAAITRDGVYAAGTSGTGAAITRDGVYAARQLGTGEAIDEDFIILPFRPSTTLNNLLESKTAVINYCDDVRIFAGCLTGHRNWPLTPAEKIDGQVLKAALAHTEVELLRIEEDALRPKLFCKAVHSVNHAPFKGFNRAQFSVLEAAILVSRLNMIPLEKIESELDYLRIGLEKTAGHKELEAWGWLMKVVDNYKAEISA